MTAGSSVWASPAARAGAGVVAAGAAALSFRATSQVAETSGAVSAGWGWIVPLVVEAGVLTAAALAWVRSGEGLRATTETVVMSGATGAVGRYQRRARRTRDSPGPGDGGGSADRPARRGRRVTP